VQECLWISKGQGLGHGALVIGTWEVPSISVCVCACVHMHDGLYQQCAHTHTRASILLSQRREQDEAFGAVCVHTGALNICDPCGWPHAYVNMYALVYVCI